KRHVEHARKRFSKKGLTATGRTDQQNVTLAQLDITLALAVTQALIVVVDSHRQHDLGAILPNHVFIQGFADFRRHWKTITGIFLGILLDFFPNDVIAQVNTLVADEHRGPCNELTDFMLALSTKRAVEQ